MSVPTKLPRITISFLALGVLASIVWTVESPVALMYVIDVTIKVSLGTESCFALPRLGTFVRSFMLPLDMAIEFILLWKNGKAC